MKIAIILGTRPEIIKMAPIIDEIEKRGITSCLIHTGQHYDKEIEEKIYDILKKYHKDEDYNLNYLITDDIVTFFLSINEGNLVTMEDLYKISGILNAKIKDMVLVNQEYRFSFEMEK